MNVSELHNKVIAAARTLPEDQRVPYGFEKRVMARLMPSARMVDAWTSWSQGLWKAAIACVLVTTCCGAWTVWAHRQPAKADFSQEFETAVFASASTDEAW
jgi:hypothetical protein